MCILSCLACVKHFSILTRSLYYGYVEWPGKVLVDVAWFHSSLSCWSIARVSLSAVTPSIPLASTTTCRVMMHRFIFLVLSFPSCRCVLPSEELPPGEPVWYSQTLLTPQPLASWMLCSVSSFRPLFLKVCSSFFCSDVITHHLS